MPPSTLSFQDPHRILKGMSPQFPQKVAIPNDAVGFLADLKEQYDIATIPPTDDIMIRAAHLPDFHKDPADRIVIATALAYDLTIVTGDGKFHQYGVRTIC